MSPTAYKSSAAKAAKIIGAAIQGAEAALSEGRIEQEPAMTDRMLGRIEQALENESLQGAARVLVGRALHEGGSDNITTAIVRVTAAPPPRTFESGAEPVEVPKPGIMSRLGRLLTGG